MNQIIPEIRNSLAECADSSLATGTERFSKEPIKTRGIKTSDAGKICKTYFKKIKHLSKYEIFSLCEILWQSGYLEESFIACEWSYLIRDRYEVDDFLVFDRWVHTYVSNWAACDTLCNHSVGALIEQFPSLIEKCKEWATSDNRWARRAAAVSLIIPARKGLFLQDIFEIADILLLDQDDLVQKGYGWMLKAASEAHVQSVYDYVIKNRDVMPRTALRYAIEKMPDVLRKEAMKKPAKTDKKF